MNGLDLEDWSSLLAFEPSAFNAKESRRKLLIGRIVSLEENQHWVAKDEHPHSER